MAGDVDAGDLVLVLFRERQNVLLGLELRDGKGGVDKHSVGRGNVVQHYLERFQIGKRFAAGEHEVAIGGDFVHPVDTLADFLSGESGHVRILIFIDAEGAVVFAVIGDEDRHRGAAFTRLVRMFHIVSRPFVSR